MPLFDRIVVVDWSASSRPKCGRDSIWIGVADTASPRARMRPENPPTRARATERLAELINEGAGRTLVGVDFPLGFPEGFARDAGLDGPAGAGQGGEPVAGGQRPWAATWRHLRATVVDGPDNANNRFEVAADLNRRVQMARGCPGGPFWGCPQGWERPTLSSVKTPFAPGRVPEWRRTDLAARSWRWVSSCWQLFYPGSVGGQALLGIPAVASLLEGRGLRGGGRVWPFQTGFRADPLAGRSEGVVVAEVWPAAALPRTARELSADEVRDELQVRWLSARLAALDRQGRLRSLFDVALGTRSRRAVEGEEGWILGVPATPGGSRMSAGTRPGRAARPFP